jgi:exodeoxyribonuclease VII small subunit
MRASKTFPKTFEEGIARLETILADMQSPDTTLADAVKLYAEAANLVTYCNETLNKTAVQIEEIDAKLAQEMPDTTDERGEQG